MKRLAILLALLMFLGEARAEVTVSVLDVGTADAILIESGARAMMIDTGKAYHAESTAAKVARVGALDYVVLTHVHADHIGGFPTIAEEHAIGQVIASFATTLDTLVYAAYEAAVAKHFLPVRCPEVGDERHEIVGMLLPPSSDDFFRRLKRSFLSIGHAGGTLRQDRPSPTALPPQTIANACCSQRMIPTVSCVPFDLAADDESVSIQHFGDGTLAPPCLQHWG